MAYERTIVALFKRREDAEQAIASLVKAGFRPEEIGYLEATDVLRLKDSTKGAVEGATVGATSGAVIGGVLVAAAVGLIPGVGPALAAGSLLPVVAGAVTGGIAGAEIGGLLGAELDEEEELYFMEEVQAGRILVTVETDRDEEAAALLRNHAPFEVDSLGTATLHARLRHPSAR
ncbi:MAG TPA: hypothetical protein VND96_07255 [Candidatus Micrarchaeaceae archaeon]|nr:hypothetical protein [Candidatus Micrarchaeaceae archaeon]